MSQAQYLFVAAIVLLIVAYFLIFVIRGRISQKDRLLQTKLDMAKDTSFINIGLKNREQQYQARRRSEEAEKNVLAMQDKQEEMEANREAIYAAPLTKKEWIEKEYRVGEEKEATFPEIHRKKPK